MKTGYKIHGASSLIRRLSKHPEIINREVESVLREEARALCVAYGAKTRPYGMDESAATGFRGTVDGDVRTVFASRQAAARVFLLLQSRDPGLAKAYWHAYKNNKPRKMGQILTRANLPQGIDLSALKAARTGRGGRVRRKGAVPASIATEAQLRATSRKQQQLVGFAKAGWYAAAKGLGGRVRSNSTDSSGKRSTAEIFPSYVRKIARRYPGIGGALISPGRVEIHTSVRHADVALNSANYARATDEARDSLAASLNRAVIALNRKHFDVA